MDPQHLQVRTRVSAAIQAVSIAELARGVVGDTAVAMGAGERIRAARRVRMAALTLVDRVVIAEIAGGATWEQVADALAITPEVAEQTYAETVAEWREGTVDEDDALGAPEVGLCTPGNVQSTAQTLDCWYARHAEPWDAIGKAPLGELLFNAASGDGG